MYVKLCSYSYLLECLIKNMEKLRSLMMFHSISCLCPFYNIVPFVFCFSLVYKYFAFLSILSTENDMRYHLSIKGFSRFLTKLKSGKLRNLTSVFTDQNMMWEKHHKAFYILWKTFSSSVVRPSILFFLS